MSKNKEQRQQKAGSSGGQVDAGVMPCPRIELKWFKTGDTWREDKDGNVVHNENYIEVNRTRVTGGRQTPPIWEDGEVETPFRDGAHAKWDSGALGGIPVFSVCGDAVSQMNVEA